MSGCGRASKSPAPSTATPPGTGGRGRAAVPFACVFFFAPARKSCVRYHRIPPPPRVCTQYLERAKTCRLGFWRDLGTTWIGGNHIGDREIATAGSKHVVRARFLVPHLQEYFTAVSQERGRRWGRGGGGGGRGDTLMPRHMMYITRCSTMSSDLVKSPHESSTIPTNRSMYPTTKSFAGSSVSKRSHRRRLKTSPAVRIGGALLTVALALRIPADRSEHSCCSDCQSVCLRVCAWY